MAEGYSGITNGYMFAAQANLGMAQTLRLTMRMPSVANRIFDTKQHAQDFIDDISTKASAIEGLILTVFKDENFGNNGIYYVKSIASSKTENNTEVIDQHGELIQIYDSDNNKTIGSSGGSNSEDLQTLVNCIYQLKLSTGLDNDLTLPDDFNYNSIIDAIKHLETNTNIKAGDNVEITEDNVINVEDMRYDDSQIRELISSKQNQLQAGENISITNNTISAVDTIYDDSEIKNDIETLNTTKQDKLIAGTNISISGNTINIDDVFLTKEDSKSIANSIEQLKKSTGLNEKLNLPENFNYSSIIEGIESKQEKLTSGNNIIISNDNIISTDNNLFKSISNNGVGNVITSLETDNNGTLITNKSYVLSSITTTGTGNTITSAEVNNGQLELIKGETFATETQLNKKQNILTEGEYITINNETIDVKDVFLLKEDANAISNIINLLKNSIGLDSALKLPNDNFNYNSVIEGINNKENSIKTELETIKSNIITLQTSVNEIIERLNKNDSEGPILG